MIAHHLGRPDPPTSKTDVLIGLEKLVGDNAREGRVTVVVVDEAHAIEDPKVFEELRLLLNFQSQERFLVTLLLFGQPELAVAVNGNKPLEQRIGIKSRLDHLSAEELKEYIEHRLHVAGHADPPSVFNSEALELIYESTGGIPRRVNRLCDVCLLAGFGARARQIDVSVVRDEVKGLSV